MMQGVGIGLGLVPRAWALRWVVLSALVCALMANAPARAFFESNRMDVPVVLTIVPRVGEESAPTRASGFLSLPGEGGRLVLRSVDGALRVLTDGFHSAADPSVSLDATHLLFAGKRSAEDRWNIFELTLETGAIRQVTRDSGNCRSPCYQAELHSIYEDDGPRHQVTFVSDMAGALSEDGSGPATSLYSCKRDGTALRRLTYNLSSDLDPFQMGDGRIVYAAWQRVTLDRGGQGRTALFAVNIDGTDNSLFAETTGLRWKRSPCITDGGLVVFIEADDFGAGEWGQLGAVSFRRPLHSYRSLTSAANGYVYRWPAPYPGGRLLVSRRAVATPGAFEVLIYDPDSGASQVVVRDPGADVVQAQAVRKGWRPDGRSTVVNEEHAEGKLYCLSADVHGLPQRDWWPAGTTRRIRLLEGVPLAQGDASLLTPPQANPFAPGVSGSSVNGIPPLVQRRLLGEVNLSGDGSFHLTIPANTPIQLQALDQDGMALLSCGWIWAKSNEQRGCIGCHEDGELTPDNLYAEALGRPAVELLLPPERRRTVDFRRDIMPIIDRKCVGCHDQAGAAPRLDGGLELVARDDQVARFNRAYENLLARAPASDADVWQGLYVQPGQARTSRLIWHLFGRNTSRPWDGDWVDGAAKPIPPGSQYELTSDERRTFVEWIDWGAMWNGIPDGSRLPADPAVKAEAR